VTLYRECHKKPLDYQGEDAFRVELLPLASAVRAVVAFCSPAAERRSSRKLTLSAKLLPLEFNV
jgi:hypothetical protein